MKKLLTLIALIPALCFGQTVTYQSLVSPTTQDTTVAKITTTPSILNYATLNQAGITFTNGTWPATINPASINQATMVQGTTTVQLFFKPYKAPSPIPTSTTIGGTISGPITLVSNSTISGKTIDLKGASTIGINGSGVTNVHITNCKIINTGNYAILLQKCSNITIDNCFFSNVGFGVSVKSCVGVKVNSNQFLNINGIVGGDKGHAVQFNGVSGGGNQINNNRVENIAGVAVAPHDILNVYQSNGLQGDSIQVIGNWIRGGQIANATNNGAAGIVLADVGGSYQVARNNILVNPGYIGIQAQGGVHIKADHNQIYSSQTPVSLLGMGWGNYSGVASSDVVYSYNQIRWYDYNNNEHSITPNTSGLTLIGNQTNSSAMGAGILPPVIITMK
jgi:hypothetical protein